MKHTIQTNNESIEQFLARGGQIKKYPTRKCRGWRINKHSNRKIQNQKGGAR